MQKPLTFLSSLALAAAVALPVAAQDEPSVDTVVATVNDTEITLGHMLVARASLPQQYQQLPDDVLFQGILDQLVQQTALADSFTGELPPRVTLSIENETRSLTAGEAIEGVMAEDVSDEELQAAYDAQYKDAEPEQEFNASHILVETKEEADAIKVELDGGADFAEVAKEKSTGPSGPGGGSLGWFGPGMMVPEFEEAVAGMEAGGVSEPVETQFGWHVIKLNETRTGEAPVLEDVREELETQVRQTKVQEAIESLTEAAEVDRSAAEGIDPTVLKNIEWLN
ncbi:peptidylprolyl isomerase [Sulfitobacter sp. HI0082]|jgi:peptidyl-prolyl cis-trans isomerase C|uniref:peptidylprolyl isomerase n=1 Tax=unclassified Sulfitobacter TaxID=196795 RepID=UPI0007C3BC1B|nr:MULTISPECIES: peptidylprolyl isomerase [unclassified Sulfitobacter]KZZ24844.1 peptidylprolyl isomerase [Sulfitobacter sp. HI0082]HAC48142.1 peptidylprolyl isomerase [Sulfitobacter sp.]KZX94752.1 peptidylprolyl isomerase [Sulfitobacter sp. HI0021]KZX96324.1 peptidylprolyl isomerase [Sulfitobacter sp. HI0027]KZZ00201.1 peptidylprolyl isomerase [Sulfitobacter sp. HI0076]|tara:strand:- start:2341 stop:3189 length:849 start_codon:yes stop_codon:yes gene_type:complete